MASFKELKLAIQKLRADRPAEFAQFELRYPDWELWKRGPYGPQREAIELTLSEYAVLPKAQVGGNTRQKKFSIISYDIKVPLGSNVTLTGPSFSKVFCGTYYLFRRPAGYLELLKFRANLYSFPGSISPISERQIMSKLARVTEEQSPSSKQEWLT